MINCQQGTEALQPDLHNRMAFVQAMLAFLNGLQEWEGAPTGNQVLCDAGSAVNLLKASEALHIYRLISRQLC